MFCIKCGTKYDADGVYCRQCGNPLHATDTADNASQNVPPGGIPPQYYQQPPPQYYEQPPPQYYQQPPPQYPGQYGVHQSNVKLPGETMMRVFGALLAGVSVLIIIFFFRDIGFSFDLVAWFLTLAYGVTAAAMRPKNEVALIIYILGIIFALYHLAMLFFFYGDVNRVRLAVVFLSLLLTTGADKRRKIKV